MIDHFTLLLTHGLIIVALWRLMFRDELDEENAGNEPAPKPWLKNQKRNKSRRQGDA